MQSIDIRAYCSRTIKQYFRKSPLYSLVARWSLRELARREWETGEVEIRLLPLICDPARASLDIGANRGIYSYYMARYSRRCIAFEPNPRLARHLRNVLWPKVKVMEYAVSNESRQTNLYIPLEAGIELDGLSSVEGFERFRDHQLKNVTVSAVRLDDLRLPPVGFMKIDVEGHEFAALEGATSLIERDAPTILLEAEERHRTGSVHACATYLQDFGYQGFFILDGRIRDFADFEISSHQIADNVSFGSRIPGRTYINNFLFAKRSDAIDAIGTWSDTGPLGEPR